MYEDVHLKLKILIHKTISCSFIGCPERSKGFKFYCHGQDPKLVESKNVVFLENEAFSGRPEPKDPSNGVATPERKYDVTQEAIHKGNETIPTVEEPYKDHKEKKDILFQVTIKFILTSVIIYWLGK